MKQVPESTEDTINDMAMPMHDDDGGSDPHALSAATRKRKHDDASNPSGDYHQWNGDYPLAAGQGEHVKMEPLDQQEAALMAKEAAASKNAVYLANLTWYTTDLDVEKLCAEFGQLINLRFIEDRFNGKSKVRQINKPLLFHPIWLSMFLIPTSHTPKP